METASKIRLMSAGGLANFLSVTKSFAVIELRDSIASIKAGSAAYRSFFASASPSATMAASRATASLTTSTSARFFSA